MNMYMSQYNIGIHLLIRKKSEPLCEPLNELSLKISNEILTERQASDQLLNTT